jgi:hypothetical protein
MFRKKVVHINPWSWLWHLMVPYMWMVNAIAHVGTFKVLGEFRCKFLVKFRGIWTWGSKFC